jgi:hypothetical protein
LDATRRRCSSLKKSVVALLYNTSSRYQESLAFIAGLFYRSSTLV